MDKMNIDFKFVARSLRRGKTNTVLNIIGLSIGFACTLGIAVWIHYELSFDRYLPEADRIYRLTFETNTSGNRIHFARCWEKWVSRLPETFPQIEELVRLSPYRHTALKAGENKFYSDRIFATDSNFFRIFNVNLLSGNKEAILKEPYSAVISSSLAQKCFGEKDPVGQTLLLAGEYDEKMTPFTIKGVMNDTPLNSHIHFDALTSFVNPHEPPDWAYVYLLLRKGTTSGELLARLPDFIKSAEKTSVQRTFTPYLQKITDIHLLSDKDREAEPNGNITIVYLFFVIAAVLLTVSLVNFYNLNKARVLTFEKSIYIQRVLGSGSKQIILQTAAESTFSVAVAILLAFIFLSLPGHFVSFFPGLNPLNNGIMDLFRIWPFIVFIMIISVIAGTLPVSNYILREKINSGTFTPESRGGNYRLKSWRLLMTVQFTLSMILIIAAIAIFQQKKFIFSHSLGNINNDIIVLKKQNWQIRYKYNSIRDKALENPLIKNFTASMEEPGGETLDAFQVESSAIDENHKNKQLYLLSVEDNFLNFFNIPLVAGKNFSKFNRERKGEDYILNETAVKELGWTPANAIGKPFNIRFDTPEIFYGGTVVGVARDFNITTVKQKVKPYVLFQKPIFYLCFMVEIDSEHKQEAISWFRHIWEEELPDYPFQYEYIDDMYKSVYRKELNEARLTLFFSILTIILVCMGLFAITSVLTEKRTREAGIRKVNGARVIDLLIMLNSDFLKWFPFAFVVACPAGWYLMHKWLQNFTYKTELHWWVFLLSAVISLTITMLTVSLRSWKVATKNPVEALRYE